MGDAHAMATRHFLTLLDLAPNELEALLQRAIVLKRLQRTEQGPQPLKGRVLGMIFEKSSTRTRVSFETAMVQFGGHAIFLSPRDTQLGRGEPVEDTARVLTRMVDAMMIRTDAHDKLETFARFAQTPVINGLTDQSHPCQLLADMQTYLEHRGPIRGHCVAFVGDGNNMCHSYLRAARQFGFELRVTSPPGYGPDEQLLAENRAAGATIEVTHDPRAAVAGADLVVTDVWASMGQEHEKADRLARFHPYQVTPELMALAQPQAVFMHCLPAHRGEEVAHEVIEGPQSLVWDEAENRLHSQKALLEFLLAAESAPPDVY